MITTNIAFVANGHKLDFFHLIGEELIKKDYKGSIFWICISVSQYKRLIALGVKENAILLLNLDMHNKHSNIVGEYKLHELIFSDRKLKYHFQKGFNYLTNIQRPFVDFVEKQNIRYLFGETTWAHEILMNRICLYYFNNERSYLHPQSIRIPNGRFTFMDTEFQNSIYHKCENIHSLETATQTHKIPIVPVVPQRVADVAADVKKTLSKRYVLKRLLNFFIFNRLNEENKSDSPQAMLYPLRVRIANFFTEVHSKFYYKNYLSKVSLSSLEGKKFFFVTLHLQPEASVDVVGRYYEDQFLMIQNIWRILPSDYYLVVKEHTNAIGNRGKSFFSKCKSLKNVLIVNENVKSHDLLKIAQAVFSNSGTVALETALYGKQAFVFSNIFFDKLQNCHRISIDDLKTTQNYEALKAYCIERDKNKMNIEQFSEYILRSSFDGVVDPHTGSYLFEDKDNINKIADSFNLFLTGGLNE